MITLTNLNKSYGEKKILDNISLTFNDHQTTVILGPSGSGKSTLLKSLDLLVKPESGTITIDDVTLDYSKPITKEDSVNLRHKTSMVFQNWNLFPNLTVLDNITIAPIENLKVSKAEAKNRALDLLEKVNLSDYKDYYPSQLSGGQQQRISICRALAMQPSFILLDEPTSALDPELENQVLGQLQNLKELQQSMILVTHNMEFAKLAADKIIFIEDGKILFDGRTEDFFNKPTPRIKKFLSQMSLTKTD
ncbi:arginine ABC transporter ATP-binding protein ArtP [Companilactobacillus sp. RD055328]|uniref:amino acid ABC transporter ATP-binding protein n=1 Tax=Companilactobacillus sp. RD055328 TaxID=2916634 RepID=UPI001FC84E28|nr:amino acid ABC transporter ATP-binding protein [Companilactobacillus sp. RD055328]GKQ43107.1 arginine ABC transporter ATP-binding protein ArtP [Companilactobacillus sp. RD055328]